MTSDGSESRDSAPDAGFTRYLTLRQDTPPSSSGTSTAVLPDVAVQTVMVDGQHGSVPVRIYGDISGSGKTALVWMHGGGFVSGSLDMPEADLLARALAGAGMPVLSVDYRLARNGVCFPVPHDDVLAAWLWAHENAADLGLDPRLLCIGGAGAGGNLAVGAALHLADTNKPMPAKILLAYPFLHAELPPPADGLDEEVMEGLPRHLRFTIEDCRRTAENYIGGPVSFASSYALPGYADPFGLPPTAIMACEYDDTRGSAELYAQSLREAGVEVSYFLAEGAVRGLLNDLGTPAAQPALEFLAAELASVK